MSLIFLKKIADEWVYYIKKCKAYFKLIANLTSFNVFILNKKLQLF